MDPSHRACRREAIQAEVQAIDPPSLQSTFLPSLLPRSIFQHSSLLASPFSPVSTLSLTLPSRPERFGPKTRRSFSAPIHVHARPPARTRDAGNRGPGRRQEAGAIIAKARMQHAEMSFPFLRTYRCEPLEHR